MDVNWFKLAYTLAGGLGLFFYGMKLLSESLQASGGYWIRKIVNRLTNNRIMAVGIGILVTCFVQSSSITTVMVVGFVNAGLMDLSQAIGVILGANIGTTITGWMISIKVGNYSLLLIGLGVLPFLFSRNEKVANTARIFFAIGLVFLGLSTMSGAFKPLRTNADFLTLMSYFSAADYLTLWAAVIIGCLLTFIMQSSSAMLGITIALALSGSITYQTALALVLGENIGTTITAYLAGIGGNTAAKRAAMAHGLFNVFGVIVVTSFFWAYKDFIDLLISGDPDFLDAQGQKPNIAIHIAAGHTIFNVASVIIFLPLIGVLKKITEKIIPDADHKETKTLRFLGKKNTLSPSLSIEKAFQEIKKLSVMTLENLEHAKSYLTSDAEQNALAQKVEKYENISDNVNEEVVLFLGEVMTKKLTRNESQQTTALLRMSDELESINDYTLAIAKYTKKSFREKIKFDEKTREEMTDLFIKVQHLHELTNESIMSNSVTPVDQREILIEKIYTQAEMMKENYLLRLSKGDLPPITNLIFSDIVVSLRKIKNHSINLIEAHEKFLNK